MTCNWEDILAIMVETDKEPTEAIVGVYESRIVAGVYWDTEIEGMKRYDHPKFASPDMVRDYWSQEVNGKTRYVAPEGVLIEGREVECMLHQQMFSYHDPVQALEHVADRIPGLKKQTGVDVIVSKWDKEQLAIYGIEGSGWDIAEEDEGMDGARLAEKNPGKVVEITMAFAQLYDLTPEDYEELADLKLEPPPPLDTNWFTAEE